MKEAHVQIKQGMPYPFSEEDKQVFRSFPDNKVVQLKINDKVKVRSLIQNAWIHTIFGYVASYDKHPDWNTKNKVKRRVKLKMQFFKDEVSVLPNGKVAFEFRSFAFDKMSQDEANEVYNEARDICAEFLGVDPEKLQAYAEGE